MKIYLKILTLGLFSSLLFGTTLPNIWTTGFGQGWLEYNISNEKEQRLIISCNVGYDDETDHNIVFSTSSKEFSGEDLAFIMDGNAYYPLSMPTNTRNGANMWSEFSNDISNAQKIEVYNENQKIAIQDTVIAFNELLAIEKDKNTLQVEALKDKEQLIVASEKVQNAVKKYKEKKSNETIKNDCPKPVPFSL